MRHAHHLPVFPQDVPCGSPPVECHCGLHVMSGQLGEFSKELFQRLRG